MRMSRPRDAEQSIYVTIRDSKTGSSVTKTYYETDADKVFSLLDAACDDAPAPAEASAN